MTCSPPTKKFSGAAARASTRPSSINPLRIRTAPTYSSPTLPMSTIPFVPVDEVLCPEVFVAGCHGSTVRSWAWQSTQGRIASRVRATTPAGRRRGDDVWFVAGAFGTVDERVAGRRAEGKPWCRVDSRGRRATHRARDSGGGGADGPALLGGAVLRAAVDVHRHGDLPRDWPERRTLYSRNEAVKALTRW